MTRRRKDSVVMRPEEVRKRIQCTQLINRLHAHIFDGLELSTSQVRAIDILLRKCIPDLTSTTVTADINVRYVAHLPEPITREAWLAKYSGDYLDDTKLIEGTTNGGGGNGSAH